MTNGNHHPEGGTTAKPRPATATSGKPDQTQAKPGQGKTSTSK